MKRASSFLFLAAVAALLVPVRPAGAANTAPALEAFNSTFSKVNDYEYRLRAHEIKGSSSQDRVYHYWFLKPHFAKTLIESGDSKGSGGVWAGGDQVSGHQGGFLSGIHLKVGLHDGRATSLRGYTIPDGLIQSIVATFENVKGDVKQSSGGPIDGSPTDLIVLKVADPATNGGVTEQRIYFSRDTHFPVRELQYEGSNIVLDQSFLDVKTNEGLKESDFPF